MKFTTTLKVGLLAAVLVVASVSAASAQERQAMFDRFKARYGRAYATPAEEGKRFAIFNENMDIAARHSASNPQAAFGVNEFADVSKEEFKVYHSAEHIFAREAARKAAAGNPNLLRKDQMPASAAGQKIDWRQKGVVTAVKNQGLKCGSCYSFSTTGNIEGQWAIAGNQLTSLSEQEIVSCQPPPAPKAGGCHGGLPDLSFEWLMSAHNGAIVTEASYPYVSGDGVVPACNMNNRQFGARISGHHDVPHDEDSMAAYTYANGPLSIGVDGSSFQTYTGGILTNCQSTQVDHAVLIVGFDDTGSTPYWIIKNSWGPGWGEEGYIRVAKGSDQCLITTAPSSSIVSGSNPQPPSPPSPPAQPTPAPWNPPPQPPTPAGNNYTYYVCEGSDCSGNCRQFSFPNGACIDNESAGTSFQAQCTNGGANVQYKGFPYSQQCQGQAEQQTIQSNTCYQNEASGYYIKFDC